MNARDKIDAKVIAHLIYEHDKELSESEVIYLAMRIHRAADEFGIGYPAALKYVISDPDWGV